MNPPYHTALGEPLEATPLDRFECPAGRMFVHDVCQGVPAEFSDCDVFYADPPWRRGYDRFLARAGVNAAPSYADFARHLDRVARTLTPPVVYVAGREARRLLRADVERPVLLNGAPAIAYAYRLEVPGIVQDAAELLNWMATQYQCVGDFLAGYGRAGRIFAAAGKRFVMSDLDPRCVGCVAQQAKDW